MQFDPAFQQSCSIPVQTFPPEERAFVEAEYAKHKVLLEYGSGGSTLLAAQQDHPLVMTVENDKTWAQNMTQTLAQLYPDAPVKLHWVDTGPTQAWGRPRSNGAERGWRNYPKYALNIWDQPFFRHPDLILIDGRFRTACFMTALMRIERPVTVLFDDYANRRRYHWIERHAPVQEMIGRMAKFRLQPTQWNAKDLTRILTAFLDPD
ncbi:hypothetical protein J7382_17115 [Shimia sp. R11_0]|uniref:hypothetical protein n=1 Tax=Shimia sp. R11_0 TaxID=2821096 RepID=UPI001ADB809A|nr:hypothetical protein [Shimia sp. R11_0]MBO9479268.1 hypothetical protein [Shimia sp. R11_0]